jgi:hypothetical protein
MNKPSKPNTEKKLVLEKSTVRQLQTSLSEDQLKAIVGGAAPRCSSCPTSLR